MFPPLFGRRGTVKISVQTFIKRGEQDDVYADKKAFGGTGVLVTLGAAYALWFVPMNIVQELLTLAVGLGVQY